MKQKRLVLIMREKKNHLYVDSEERKLLLHSLVGLKNQLIQQGRYADCVTLSATRNTLLTSSTQGRKQPLCIIEAECCLDHIHMLVRIPPKYSVSEIVGYLKGKSLLMIFEKHANLKYKYGNRHFWCRGY